MITTIQGLRVLRETRLISAERRTDVGGRWGIRQDGKGAEAETPPKLGEQRQQREAKGRLEKAGTKPTSTHLDEATRGRQGEGCVERLREDRQLPL